MVQINWTKRAFQDTDIIRKYISVDSELYANITIIKFKTRVEILKQFPFIGRVVPEFNLEYIRELIEGNYRVIYKIVDKSQVDILAIVHGARNISDIDIKM
jgi:plasmid stabilization system protein ParE